MSKKISEENKVEGNVKISHTERARRITEEFLSKGDSLSTLDLGARLPSWNEWDVPDEFEYSWKDCLTPNGDGISYVKLNQLRILGYEIVEPSRHPEMRQSEEDVGYISYGNLVLLERPKAAARIDAERSYRRMNADINALNSLTEQGYTGNRSRINTETSITREKSPVTVSSGDLSEFISEYQ